MSKNADVYKNEFIKKFSQSEIFKEEQAAFSNILGNIQWQLFVSANKKEIFNDLKSAGLCLTHNHKKALTVNINKAKKTRKPVQFKNNGFYDLCVPLGRGDNIYGYMALIGLKRELLSPSLSLLCSFTNSVMEEVNKEIELSKLYDVIRPRAIALSTIHTIHRLIGSTLDINELFPRIARLALQVLRAERIAIYIKDKAESKLRCAATVNYAKSKDYFKITETHNPLAKKVYSSGRSILKKDMLAVPLIEEDVLGVIIVRNKIDKKEFTIFDQEILNTLAEQAVIAIRNASLYKEQQDITIGSIKSLASLLDLKLPGVYTHTNLFVELMLALGRETGLSDNEMRNLHFSALLPDLGKVFVPEQILKKPAPLDKKEFNIVKKHTKKAVEIMQHLSALKSTIPIILHHHERHDGTGYPDGLKADKIPIGARIMAVADAFEAMMMERPHRPRLKVAKAVAEIESKSGTQFDPKVVTAFMRLFNDDRLDNLVKAHKHELKKIF
ncbi:MAG: HD domain-containing protein [Candidatus Omnitrophica bacterium]|nr:HD domain-containing protein [Candidatus Omnitrophota bacterium]